MVVLGLFILWDPKSDSINKYVRKLIKKEPKFKFEPGCLGIDDLYVYAEDIMVSGTILSDMERAHFHNHKRLKKIYNKLIHKINLHRHSITFAWVIRDFSPLK